MKTLEKQSRIGKNIKKAKGPKTIDYKEDFLDIELRDLDKAASYLSAAVDEGEEVFLLAIRDVVEAQGGIKTIAKSTKLNRENLYDMLSKKGNPRLSSMTNILDKLGLTIKIAPKLRGNKAA